MSPDDLRAYVAASRARQGLPPTVTDPATLERVATVFRLMALDELAPPKPRKRRKPPASTRSADPPGERPAA